MSTSYAPFTTVPTGYQLPEALRLGAVTLQVSDLDRSVAYYEQIIGLRVVQRDAGSAALAAALGGDVIVHLVEKRGVHPVPQRGLLGLYHFAILLPTRAHLGQFLAHLANRNVRAGMSDHLVSEALYLSDPDGLGIEIYADRPRSTWKLDGPAIAMATDPLDVRDLIASAEGNTWKGAPAGTRIGHVHLYVGDIDQAERFYHQGLGFDKVNLQFRGALFMSAGGYHHHLGTNIWAAGSPMATDKDARLLEWQVILPTSDDVEGAERSVRQLGVSVDHSGESFTANDPWGTMVRVLREQAA